MLYIKQPQPSPPPWQKHPAQLLTPLLHLPLLQETRGSQALPSGRSPCSKSLSTPTSSGEAGRGWGSGPVPARLGDAC